jgi:hypothetical protein
MHGGVTDLNRNLLASQEPKFNHKQHERTFLNESKVQLTDLNGNLLAPQEHREPIPTWDAVTMS